MVLRVSCVSRKGCEFVRWEERERESERGSLDCSAAPFSATVAGVQQMTSSLCRTHTHTYIYSPARAGC